MADELRVFILGSPRSGTSIMYYAMREVLGLKGRGESHVFPLFQRLVHQYHTYAADMRKIPGVLAGDLDTKQFRQAMSDYLRAFYAQAYGAGGFVDKTPGAEAIRGCSLIEESFPQARILLLQRNGIEVVHSYRSKFSANFRDACQSWCHVVDTMREILPAHPDVLIVDQFDLTNHPGQAAKRIGAHLCRPELEARLAEFFASRRVDKHSAHDWTKRQTLADMDWTDAEKTIFQELCGASMAALGYEL